MAGKTETRKRRQTKPTEAERYGVRPEYIEFAKTIKARQVQAFFEFLIECGLDKFLDAAIELVGRGDMSKGSTAQDQVSGPQIDEAEIIASLDLGGMLRKLAGQEGGLFRLFAIIQDCDESEVGEVDMWTLEANFTNFAAVATQPMNMLLGIGRS
jgi:hypothetical protein